MEKVTGIGGFFFRSKNPGALDDWYDRKVITVHPAICYARGR